MFVKRDAVWGGRQCSVVSDQWPDLDREKKRINLRKNIWNQLVTGIPHAPNLAKILETNDLPAKYSMQRT